MSVTIEAEFDIVDLADLASGRVKHIPGVQKTWVINSKTEQSRGLPDPMSNPYLGTNITLQSIYFPSAYPTAQFAYGPVDKDYEPGESRTALLKAEVRSKESARQVASVLSNLGGRNIRVF